MNNIVSFKGSTEQGLSPENSLTLDEILLPPNLSAETRREKMGQSGTVSLARGPALRPSAVTQRGWCWAGARAACSVSLRGHSFLLENALYLRIHGK